MGKESRAAGSGRQRATGRRAATATLTIRAPLAQAELPGLYARACRLLAAEDIDRLACETAGIAADAVAVDALARLALAARRHGCTVQLRGASAELMELLELAGLASVLAGPRRL
ncbi:MAG TPA: STAS domain-containing protein [Solirubrobacteraceae bacterium]|jgi:ABC-type transporter Mla MlaB component